MLRRVAATLTAATLFVACQTAAPPRPTVPPLTTATATSPAPHQTPSQSSATVAPAVTLSVDPVPEGQTQQATVLNVTDGDTIRVDIEGAEFRLRYIGMDAPETVAPDKPVEPGGPEASARNK